METKSSIENTLSKSAVEFQQAAQKHRSYLDQQISFPTLPQPRFLNNPIQFNANWCEHIIGM